MNGRVAFNDPRLGERLFTGLKNIGRNATYAASSLEAHYSGEKDKLLTGGSQGTFAFHTKNEKNPNIIIDLKSVRTVCGLIINNRSDLPERAATLSLSASSDGATWTPAWKAEKADLQWVAIPESAVAGAKVKRIDARYLKLETQNDSPLPLHLQGVEIYGK